VKKASVIWSAEALADLGTIYDFIVEKSQQAAERIVNVILARTKQLESFPESGAMQEAVKIKSKEYRYLVEGNYKIIYSHQPGIQVVYVEIIFDTRYNPDILKV
jgi:toxin ParE1/3/4